MSRRTVIARITTREGARDAAVAIFEEAVASTRDEPGTLIYRLHTDRREPNTVWFYEEYEDKASFDAHMAGPTLTSVGARIADLLAGPPEMFVLELVAEK